MQDLILILNDDNRQAMIIATALRAEGIRCRVVPGDISAAEVEAAAPGGVILTGGAPLCAFDSRLLCSALPILALGGSARSLCLQLGGEVAQGLPARDIADMILEGDPLFGDGQDGLRCETDVLPLTLPETAHAVIRGEDEAVLGFVHNDLPLYGLQLTPEKNNPDWSDILLRFARDLCGCAADWNTEKFISETVEEIRAAAGEDGIALCAISGGIDSGVSALLGHLALGDRMRAFFVDTGFFRRGEKEEVLRVYRDRMGLDVTVLDEADSFLAAMEGVTENRQKQHIVSRRLAQILDGQFSGLNASLLLKGTNCADLMMENGSAGDERDFLPVKELFKDEIRAVGRALGLPEEAVNRQSFPGSGLANRIGGEVTAEKLALLRECDAIFREEIEAAALQKKLFKYFTVLQPNRDGMVVLRALSASGSPARLPYEVLENVAQRVDKLTGGKCRVVYDMTMTDIKENMEWA